MKRLERVDTSPLAAWRDLDTAARVERFAKRVRDRIGAQESVAALRDDGEFGLERLIGKVNDILSIEFLEQGSQAARSVCRIEFMGTAVGTGFLVAPNIVLTNHHVLPDEPTARLAEAVFFSEDRRIRPHRNQLYRPLNPEAFFFSDEELDFAFVSIEGPSSGSPENAVGEGTSSSGSVLDECGWLPLLEEQGKILIGHPVNLIQHPDGGQKKLVVQNSVLLELSDQNAHEEYCWYSGDTMKGSSGSPVLSNFWEVVALHRRSVPRTDRLGNVLDENGKQISDERYKANPDSVHWIANEGVRVSRVVRCLREAQLPSLPMNATRDRLLRLWATQEARRVGFKSGWYGVNEGG